MRTFLLTTLFCLALLSSLHAARADQGPAPSNVGMSAFTATTVGVATATPLILRNLNRVGIFLQNQGAVAVVCKPGGVPANTTDGIVLIAGQQFQMNPTPVDALYCQSASATAKIIAIEFVK